MKRRMLGSASTGFLILAAVVTAPLLTQAARMATSVTITNNSSRELHHIYLSPTNQDNWGRDQLEPTVISSGGSFTLSDVSCSGTDAKVIVEDQDGCFMYQVISCGQSTTWNITNETARDCGN